MSPLNNINTNIYFYKMKQNKEEIIWDDDIPTRVQMPNLLKLLMSSSLVMRSMAEERYNMPFLKRYLDFFEAKNKIILNVKKKN